ncbi:methyltransferase [Amycolatopsis sp. WAC 04182]|uniref:methyltransferase n=1 Tax=Amycolatopsis sp. WAC 04182 TaxID=2203198 RepID=UPI001F254AAE|nr:methyltransferase [Amycolatopsis sp. WAC 04182]
MPEHEGDYRELRRKIMGYIVSQAIFAVTEAGVVDLLAEGPVEVESLAGEARVDADALTRFLRVLVAEDLFVEEPRGTFGLTAGGELLRSDQPGSLRHLVTLMRGESYLAWQDAGHSLRTGEAGFDAVFGKPLFEWLAAHPEQAADFDAAQAGLVAKRMEPLLDSAWWDWSGTSSVVDIGGGNGTLIGALLARHGHLTGRLFDQPHVVEHADLTAHGAGVADRCEVVGGDFFAAVPGGADVYLLAQILHDWSDEDAVLILRRIREAIPPHGRLLILEQIIPDDDRPHPEKLLDLHMLVLLGGRERGEAEWRGLLVEGGFDLVEVHRGPRSSLLVAAAAA